MMMHALGGNLRLLKGAARIDLPASLIDSSPGRRGAARRGVVAVASRRLLYVAEPRLRKASFLIPDRMGSTPGFYQ